MPCLMLKKKINLTGALNLDFIAMHVDKNIWSYA